MIAPGILLYVAAAAGVFGLVGWAIGNSFGFDAGLRYGADERAKLRKRLDMVTVRARLGMSYQEEDAGDE